MKWIYIVDIICVKSVYDLKKKRYSVLKVTDWQISWYHIIGDLLILLGDSFLITEQVSM